MAQLLSKYLKIDLKPLRLFSFTYVFGLHEVINAHFVKYLERRSNDQIHNVICVGSFRHN